MDAGYRFVALAGGTPFRGRGIGVPTLEAVLIEFPDVPVIIEMKEAQPALAHGILTVLRRTKSQERVCVGSFYRRSLEALRAEERGVATSASELEARWTLYRSWCRWPVATRRPYCAFQVPEYAGRLRVVSRAFVSQAHRDHARVDVWVCARVV